MQNGEMSLLVRLYSAVGLGRPFFPCSRVDRGPKGFVYLRHYPHENENRGCKTSDYLGQKNCFVSGRHLVATGKRILDYASLCVKSAIGG